MSGVHTLTVETDAAGAAELEKVVAAFPDAEYSAEEVLGQVGGPDTWMFVVEMTQYMSVPVIAAVVTLRSRITRAHIDDEVIPDVTAEALEAAVNAPGDRVPD